MVKEVLMAERGSATLFLPLPCPLWAAQRGQGAKNLGQVSLHFPVSDWFQLSLLTCAQSLCSPACTSWPGPSCPTTHSPFYSPSATGTASPTHDRVGPSQRQPSCILSFHTVSNYAGSSWKHDLQYNFGKAFSEGISFSDCLRESEPPCANSCLFLLVLLVALSSLWRYMVPVEYMGKTRGWATRTRAHRTPV